MIILAYGIKQPTNGDRGAVFFPALEELCQRMASHKHDDIDSHPISGGVIKVGTVNAPNTNWALESLGIYSQTVTLPAGFTVANSLIEVRILSTNERVYAKVEQVTTTSIKVYTGVPTVSYRIFVK